MEMTFLETFRGVGAVVGMNAILAIIKAMNVEPAYLAEVELMEPENSKDSMVKRFLRQIGCQP